MKWILRIIVQCAWLLGKGDSTKKLVIEEFKSRKRKRKWRKFKIQTFVKEQKIIFQHFSLIKSFSWIKYRENFEIFAVLNLSTLSASLHKNVNALKKLWKPKQLKKKFQSPPQLCSNWFKLSLIFLIFSSTFSTSLLNCIHDHALDTRSTFPFLSLSLSLLTLVKKFN